MANAATAGTGSDRLGSCRKVYCSVGHCSLQHCALFTAAVRTVYCSSTHYLVFTAVPYKMCRAHTDKVSLNGSTQSLCTEVHCDIRMHCKKVTFVQLCYSHCTVY